MDKLWTVAVKDIRTRFTDRRLLVLMLAAPLALATIIGLAFGELAGKSSPIGNIPMIVINNDQPDAFGVAYGSILTNLLTTGQLPTNTNTSLSGCPQAATNLGSGSNATSMTLSEFIHGTIFDADLVQKLLVDKKIEVPAGTLGSPDYVSAAAKAAVDKGIFAALVVIPADFSTALTSMADRRQVQTNATITVYGNAGDSLSPGIVRSVVDSITNQLVSVNSAIGATLPTLAQVQPAALASASKMDFGKLFVCNFIPGTALVRIADQPVQAAPNSLPGRLIVTFGSANALIFAMLMARNGVLSMYEERKNWTLQRILVSPTPPWAILGGKLVGVFVSVLFQMLVLMAAMTVVGSLMEGRLSFIWGTDILMLVLVLLATCTAVAGFAILLVGILKGVEQANTVGALIGLALGILGGAYGFQPPRSMGQFSLIYWARDAFDMLAAGHGNIWPNILVLFVQGALMFWIGLFLFNRKFEV